MPCLAHAPEPNREKDSSQLPVPAKHSATTRGRFATPNQSLPLFRLPPPHQCKPKKKKKKRDETSEQKKFGVPFRSTNGDLGILFGVLIPCAQLNWLGGSSCTRRVVAPPPFPRMERPGHGKWDCGHLCSVGIGPSEQTNR